MGVSGLAETILQDALTSRQLGDQERQRKFENINNIGQSLGNLATGIVGGVKAVRENPEAFVSPDRQTTADRLSLARQLELDKSLGLEDKFTKVEELKNQLAQNKLPLSERVQARRELRQVRREINSKLPSEQLMFAELQALRQGELSLAEIAARRKAAEDSQSSIDVDREKDRAVKIIESERTDFDKKFGQSALNSFAILKKNAVNGAVDRRGSSTAVSLALKTSFDSLDRNKLKLVADGFYNLVTDQANKVINSNDSEQDKAVKLSKIIIANSGIADPELSKKFLVNQVAEQLWAESGLPKEAFQNDAVHDGVKRDFANVIKDALTNNPNLQFEELMNFKNKETLKSLDRISSKYKVPLTSYFKFGELNSPEAIRQSVVEGLAKTQVAKELSGPDKVALIDNAIKTKSGRYWDFLQAWGFAKGFKTLDQVVADFKQGSQPTKTQSTAGIPTVQKK